jgi:hypothetical protein
MYKINIINLSEIDNIELIPEIVIYCGKGTALNNIYDSQSKYSEEEAYDKYKNELWKLYDNNKLSKSQKALFTKITLSLGRYRNIALSCNCEHKLCHCNIIKEIALDMMSKLNSKNSKIRRFASNVN